MATSKTVIYHKGIYRFQFPYLGPWLSSNDNGTVNVYHCDVEIHVGQEEDMQNGKIATIVITAQNGSIGIQNHIEHLATKIRFAFFDSIFYEQHWKKPVVPEEGIRWIERHLFSKQSSTMDDEVKEVTLQWDAKKYAYHSPTWRSVKNVW